MAKTGSTSLLKSEYFLILGPTGADEMCNLYLMYYSYSKTDDFKICFEEQNPSLSSRLPQGLFFFLRSSFVLCRSNSVCLSVCLCDILFYCMYNSFSMMDGFASRYRILVCSVCSTRSCHFLLSFSRAGRREFVLILVDGVDN